MEWINIILILFLLFALSRSILRYKGKEIRLNEFIFWTAIWVLGIIALASPSTVSYISQSIGIGRPADMIVYLSIIILFYINFRMYVALDNMDQKLTKVVREVAIKREKKK